jgi:hypothetical protein
VPATGFIPVGRWPVRAASRAVAGTRPNEQLGSPHRTTWCPRPGWASAPGQSHGD